MSGTFEGTGLLTVRGGRNRAVKSWDKYTSVGIFIP